MNSLKGFRKPFWIWFLSCTFYLWLFISSMVCRFFNKRGRALLTCVDNKNWIRMALLAVSEATAPELKSDLRFENWNQWPRLPNNPCASYLYGVNLFGNLWDHHNDLQTASEVKSDLIFEISDPNYPLMHVHISHWPDGFAAGKNVRALVVTRQGRKSENLARLCWYFQTTRFLIMHYMHKCTGWMYGGCILIDSDFSTLTQRVVSGVRCDRQFGTLVVYIFLGSTTLYACWQDAYVLHVSTVLVAQLSRFPVMTVDRWYLLELNLVVPWKNTSRAKILPVSVWQ